MSLIKSDFIDRIISETNILDVFRKNNHEIKKSGAHFICKSPFNDERTESCVIDTKKDMFFDKSANISGNVISYYTKVKNLSFPEAIAELAKLNNIDVEYESNADTAKYLEKKKKVDEFRPILEFTQKKLVEQLNLLPRDSEAWKELKKRGYNEELVKEYGIGFAPGKQFFYKIFSDSGVVSPAQELGLVNFNTNDKINFRLTYPIFDKQNKILGFASRALKPDDKVKWMNPSNSELFNKSSQWYGINFAFSKIAKTNTAWIVEGYNDVIAWQNLGITNTISPYGKELSQGQISELKKHAHKAIICLDNDKAGIDGMLRNIPSLFANEFNVEICQLPDHEVDGRVEKMDPDDFSRIYQKEISEYDGSFEEYLRSKGYVSNGFDFLIKNIVIGDTKIEKAEGVKRCVEIISTISDATFRNLYTEMLQERTKFKATIIKEISKEIEAEKWAKENKKYGNYDLPRSIEHIDITKYLKNIEDYGFFQAENQIWMLVERIDEPDTFRSISNFSIEIIQHMNDDKFPKKLLKIKNIRNVERIFDAAADSINNTGVFTKLLDSQGNYRFKGTPYHLENLKDYLYDSMGTGRSVDVLGWNPEGFFIWNNQVTIPGKGNIKMDENGIFHHNDITYYVPSANSIYANNPTRYIAQKRVIVREASITLTQYLSQLRKVHRGHSITGILFTIASAFQDFIAPTIKGFPMLLLYGAASSGKDQLSHCMRSFFGKPQSVIALGSKKSTGKAQIREFAQFANVITHLSEYNSGDRETDEMLKGLWDRNGYKFGTIESRVSSEEVPILSSALVTGNQFPSDEALISRFLWEEMQKDVFSEAEKSEYEKLEDMSVDGLSSFMAEIILNRENVERRFVKEHRFWTKEISQRNAFKNLKSRIITNHAVIAAMYEIFNEEIKFPFTREEMLEHFDEMASNQTRRLDSESVSSKFWQRFVAALRGTSDKKLIKDRDFKIEGNHLYIRWMDTYNAIQPTWHLSFEQTCPSRNDLRKRMMDDNSFIEDIKAVKFGRGANAIVTTALLFDIEKIKDKTDIMYAIHHQPSVINIENNFDSTINERGENKKVNF